MRVYSSFQIVLHLIKILFKFDQFQTSKKFNKMQQNIAKISTCGNVRGKIEIC